MYHTIHSKKKTVKKMFKRFSKKEKEKLCIAFAQNVTISICSCFNRYDSPPVLINLASRFFGNNFILV